MVDERSRFVLRRLLRESGVEPESGCYSLACFRRIAALDAHSFSGLPNLRSLDLSGNRLALIHPEALSIPASPLQGLNLSRSLYNSTSLTDLATALRWGGLRGLLRLDLSGNRLALLPPGMFSHLPGLQELFLANNSLAAIYGGTFTGVNHLRVLDLADNAFATFRTDDLRELDGLGNVQILLGGNPYACSCQIRNFVAWLNESGARVDLEALRCASPEELSNTQLWGISALAIGCAAPAEGEGGGDLALQTSYVFLGLVLGLVGMVFLFVLYLNRHGMKKWITDMRDACRDVMEGYHYRFEIDSDPRLGHISAQNGGGGGGTRRSPGGALPQQLPSDTCITRVPSTTHAKQLTTSSPVSL